MTLQRLKGFIADIMLHFAGVRNCRIPVNAETDEKIRKISVPLVYFFGNLKTRFGKSNMPLFVYGDITAFF